MSEQDLKSVRIDKWLWAVRICKTRKIAYDLCKEHKVLIDDQPVKPSREIRPGQVIIVKREGIEYQYKVLQCLEKRVGAGLAGQYKEDITPKETLEKLEMIRKNAMPPRPRGAGRPTKKERRNLIKFKSGNW